jgi:hypothetical protein
MHRMHPGSPTGIADTAPGMQQWCSKDGMIVTYAAYEPLQGGS